MTIAAAVLSVLLAVIALGAGTPKVLLRGDVPSGLQSHMGLSPGLVRLIGAAEISAAIGLITGIFWQPIGIAAAVGFALLLVGAVAFHARAGDYKTPETRGAAVAPIVLIVLSSAAAVALILAN